LKFRRGILFNLLHPFADIPNAAVGQVNVPRASPLRFLTYGVDDDQTTLHQREVEQPVFHTAIFRAKFPEIAADLLDE